MNTSSIVTSWVKLSSQQQTSKIFQNLWYREQGLEVTDDIDVIDVIDFIVVTLQCPEGEEDGVRLLGFVEPLVLALLQDASEQVKAQPEQIGFNKYNDSGDLKLIFFLILML